MSEFSKEYLNAIGSSLKGDFSYQDELLMVEEGTLVDEICEGFGSIGAISIANEPYLFFSGRDPVKLFDAIHKLRIKQEISLLDSLLTKSLQS